MMPSNGLLNFYLIAIISGCNQKNTETTVGPSVMGFSIGQTVAGSIEGEHLRTVEGVWEGGKHISYLNSKGRVIMVRWLAEGKNCERLKSVASQYPTQPLGWCEGVDSHHVDFIDLLFVSEPMTAPGQCSLVYGTLAWNGLLGAIATRMRVDGVLKGSIDWSCLQGENCSVIGLPSVSTLSERKLTIRVPDKACTGLRSRFESPESSVNAGGGQIEYSGCGRSVTITPEVEMCLLEVEGKLDDLW
jgi:hypothetical protein